MTIFALFMAAVLAVPAPAAGGQPPLSRFETTAQPPVSDGVGQTDDIRITDDAFERMTVPVQLAGAGPFRFLVDTGSDRTAVSRELASKLGLEAGRSAMLHSATGQSQVQMAVVRELTLSRKSVRRIDAPVLDAKNMGADGILGIDSLRSHRVLFDFASQTLSITSAESPVTREEEDAIVIRARRREGRLVITDAEAEGQRVSVVLDTGSQVTLGNEALRRRLEQRGALTLVGPIEILSVTGEALVGELAIIRGLEIGGVTMENLAIVFADAHTFRQLALDKAPAMLLGMNALRSFDKVSIDFASKKVRLVVPRLDRRGRVAGRAFKR
jgi:predicted aspartyl protease